MKQKKIVTIGGGSGTAIINEALLWAGVKEISSIVTVMDSGGITGRMRTDSRGAEVAYSDGLRTLLSLIPPRLAGTEKVRKLREFLRKRNDRGQDLGYTIFSHYFSRETGFWEIQNLLTDLTGIKFMGRIIPVTTQSCNLMFQTESGRTYRGEHELDDKRMSADCVSRIWLDPEVTAYIKAVEAIADADVIIFACGSFYGSVLVNLLPKGIKQAFKFTRAAKILVTNLASTRNETDNFRPVDFIASFQKYSGLSDPLDYLIVPKMTRKQFEKKYPKVATAYKMEQSHFLGWEEEELLEAQKAGAEIILHNATVIDPKLFRLRHDPKKLAQTFRKLLV